MTKKQKEIKIIEIYNNGQNELTLYKNECHELYIERGRKSIINASYINPFQLYFDSQFKFARVFSKWIYENDKCYILTGGHNLEKDYSYEAIQFDLENDLLQEMVLKKDILKYLTGYL